MLGGLAIFLLADIGAISIVVARSWATTRAMNSGLVILGASLVVAVTAIALTSSTFFFTGTALTGVGFELAWLDVLRTRVALAAPTARAALLAAVFIVAYLALALPAVVAGFLANPDRAARRCALVRCGPEGPVDRRTARYLAGENPTSR